MNLKTVFAFLSFAMLAGCAVNPVTGDRDFIIVSGEQELALGVQNYAPMKQSQGGVYDVDPQLTEYVSSIGNRVAAASGVDLPYEFSVLNNSIPNAWALPGGKIAINRGLLTEMNSEAELAAVLGHEVVHAAARHSAQQMSRGLLLQGAIIGTSIATSDSGYGDLAVGGASVAAQLLTMKYGRSAELESDKYGMRYMSRAGYDPQGAVELQETFVRLSEGRNQDWLTGLFSSHPPSQERVRENRRTAEKLPPGGKLGDEDYRAAMQKTRAAMPAYEAYDNGRKALGEKKPDEALALANEALTLFPEEAHFHALRGDVRLYNKQYDMAVTNYNRAVDRRDDFFYYHLQRGIARDELGQTDGAVVDLERSLELLPNLPAHYRLGRIKEQRGPLAEAIEHYKLVAKNDNGEMGKAAYERLVRLELPQQPASYIEAACGDDGSGEVIVQVRNPTPVTVADISVAFRYVDVNGNQRELGQRFSGRVASGQVVSANTGLRPYPNTRCEAAVTSAQVAE